MRSLLVCLLIAGGTTAGYCQDLAARKIYSDYADSVVLLRVESDGNPVGQGTGFYIGNGRIVTNAHVANKGAAVFIQAGPARLPTRLLHSDEVNDLAILAVDVSFDAAPLTLSSTPAVAGESIYAITNPSGLEKSMSTGVVSAIRVIEGNKLLQITTPISPGSSGGPIFNVKGEVVGVAVATLRRGQNLNFAVPVEYLRNLLIRPITKADASVLLREVESILTQRRAARYSSNEESEWQQLTARVRERLRLALDAAQSNSDQLLEVGRAALSTDVALAVDAASRATTLSPNNSAAYLLLARAQQNRAWFEEEIATKSDLLARAERSARKATQLTAKPTAEHYYTLGDILTDNSKWAEAERILRAGLQASDVERFRGSLLRELIEALDGQEKWREAVHVFGTLLTTDEVLMGWDWNSQAQRLMQLDDYNAAALAFEKAADPQGVIPVAAAICRAGWAYWVVDAADNALRAARRCLDDLADQEDSAETRAQANHLITRILNERGVYHQALVHAKEATALDPSLADAYDQMAKALIGLRRFREAATSAQTAVRLSDGKHAFMHFRLGSAYLELEEWHLARQSYEQAAQMEPKDSAAAYNVALCLWRLHYYSEAARWFEEYLRRNPTATDRAEVQENIRILRR